MTWLYGRKIGENTWDYSWISMCVHYYPGFITQMCISSTMNKQTLDYYKASKSSQMMLPAKQKRHSQNIEPSKVENREYTMHFLFMWNVWRAVIGIPFMRVILCEDLVLVLCMFIYFLLESKDLKPHQVVYCFDSILCQ